MLIAMSISVFAVNQNVIKTDGYTDLAIVSEISFDPENNKAEIWQESRVTISVSVSNAPKWTMLELIPIYDEDYFTVQTNSDGSLYWGLDLSTNISDPSIRSQAFDSDIDGYNCFYIWDEAAEGGNFSFHFTLNVKEDFKSLDEFIPVSLFIKLIDDSGDDRAEYRTTVTVNLVNADYYNINCVNASFDSIIIDNVTNFNKGDGAASSKLNSLTPARTVGGINTNYSTIILKGWAGFNYPIQAFGYKINGADPVFSDSFFGDTDDEEAIQQAGGSYGKRYEITIPVSDLTGTNKIVAVAKVNNQIIELNGDLTASGLATDPNTSFTYTTAQKVITGHQAVLQSDISYRLILAQNLPDGIIENLVITAAGKTADYNIVTEGSLTYVMIELAAKEMGDTISVTVYDQYNEFVVQTISTSLKSYLESVISIYKNTDKNLAALAEKTLVYGKTAQLYFNYNTANLVSDNSPSSVSEVTTALTALGISDSYNVSQSGFEYAGSSLVLDYKIAVKHYWEPAEGTEGMAIPGNMTIHGDYYCTETLLSPLELGEAMPYCRIVLNDDNKSDSLKNLCCAIYDYWQAARQAISVNMS